MPAAAMAGATEKTKTFISSMVMNVIETETDLVLAQFPSSAAVKYPEMMDKYTEHSTFEHGHGRTDYRTTRACTDPSILTKTQDEWPFIKTIGQTCHVRIETVRDSKGNDITPL